MDFNSSLDDIIKAKNRSSSSSYRPRHSYSPRTPNYTNYHRPDNHLRLSTSNLPNRQRRHYDDDDDLIITKSVRRRSEVDPSTIIITKKVEKRPPPPKKKDVPSTPKSPPPPPNEDQLDLQQQIQEQNEQILELQRLLQQHQQQQQQQQQQQPAPTSFLPDQLASCIVQFDNLDSAATSNDIRNACNAFGPVIRCRVISEQTGGKAQVEFLDHRAAAACVARFNQQIVDGRLLSASFLPARSIITPTRSGYRTTSHVLYTD